MHIKSCREIDSAVDEALKKHKNQVAKKSEEKKAAAVVAGQREMEAQMFPDNQMDVDMDLAVKNLYSFLFSSFSYIFTGRFTTNTIPSEIAITTSKAFRSTQSSNSHAAPVPR